MAFKNYVPEWNYNERDDDGASVPAWCMFDVFLRSFIRIPQLAADGCFQFEWSKKCIVAIRLK